MPVFSTTAKQLHDAVEAVCPIQGVAIGRVDDPSTWRIAFAEVATKEECAAAQQVLSTFQPVDEPMGKAVPAKDDPALMKLEALGLTIDDLKRLLQV